MLVEASAEKRHQWIAAFWDLSTVAKIDITQPRVKAGCSIVAIWLSVVLVEASAEMRHQ